MEYETGKFKRDTTNRNGKPTNTVRVTGLSVNSIFEDNEDLIIMSKTEFTKFENQVKELENSTPEPFTNQKYYNELLTAKDEINNLNKTISNRNGLLLGTQDKLNNLLDEFTQEITKEINKANTETITQVKVNADLIKETISNLIDYVKELENQQKSYNTKVDNSSWYKRAFSKDTFKLEINTGKLKDLDSKLNEINQYCINYKDIVKPIEIPASRISEIKLNVKSNKFDIKELYIDTTDLDDQEENIVITPEANDNGNQN